MLSSLTGTYVETPCRVRRGEIWTEIQTTRLHRGYNHDGEISYAVADKFKAREYRRRLARLNYIERHPFQYLAEQWVDGKSLMGSLNEKIGRFYFHDYDCLRYIIVADEKFNMAYSASKWLSTRKLEQQ